MKARFAVLVNGIVNTAGRECEVKQEHTLDTSSQTRKRFHPRFHEPAQARVAKGLPFISTFFAQVTRFSLV